MRLAPRGGLCALVVVALLGCKKPAATESSWQVSIDGYGPIKTGMSPDQAGIAGGRPLTKVHAGFEECDYVQFEGDTTRGVQFMVVQGHIARVDIDDSTISTNHGIRIGDPESKVQESYTDRVTVSPHKYVEGHYLTVAPGTAADSGNAIVFETDGARVTSYRAGRMPEIEYVEGCS